MPTCWHRSIVRRTINPHSKPVYSPQFVPRSAFARARTRHGIQANHQRTFGCVRSSRARAARASRATRERAKILEGIRAVARLGRVTALRARCERARGSRARGRDRRISWRRFARTRALHARRRARWTRERVGVGGRVLTASGRPSGGWRARARRCGRVRGRRAMTDVSGRRFRATQTCRRIRRRRAARGRGRTTTSSTGTPRSSGRRTRPIRVACSSSRFISRRIIRSSLQR